MHEEHWKALDGLIAKMTEAEKWQAMQRIGDSMSTRKVVRCDEEVVRQQHAAWEKLWKDMQGLQEKEPDDGLIGLIDVDKIVYGDCGRD